MMSEANTTQTPQTPINAKRPAYGFTPEPYLPLLPLEQITREWAWGNATGKGVKVAVIDSGIDATHPDISGGGVQGYIEVQQTQDDGKDRIVFDSTPHGDFYGHGTACAGIIRSLAPECELYSIRVLGPVLKGSGAVFTAGLRWAIENGMDVCNLSLGTTKRDFYATLHELVDDAYFRRVLLVTAANNFPLPSFPSVYSSVLSVASNEDEGDPFLFHFNSERGPVEFSAHGINVRAAWRDHAYMTVTGNSFAAPHITGLVALLRSQHPELDLYHVKVVLRTLAANATRSRQDAANPCR